MSYGRHICNTLKAIRRQIADANGIKYEPRECHHEGDCAGTCPACEAEVRYLEGELNRRRSMGKKVAVAGIAAGLVGLAACATSNSEDSLSMSQQTTDSVSAMTKEGDDALWVGEIVEPMPSFPNGEKALMEYLQTNCKYPQVKDSIDGRVVISFTVESDGSITEAKVVKSLAPAYDAEALRVVKAMPKWEPGRQNGEATSVKYTIPITFRKE